MNRQKIVEATVSFPDPVILRQIEEYKAEGDDGRESRPDFFHQVKQISWIIMIFMVAAVSRGIVRDSVRSSHDAENSSVSRSQQAAIRQELARGAQIQVELLHLVLELNKQLPKTFKNEYGVEVTLQRVVAGTSSIEYQFIADIPAEQLSENAPNAVKYTCSEMKPLLDIGVVVHYKYWRQALTQGSPTIDLTITRESCQGM